jgi:hypothetical protein
MCTFWVLFAMVGIVLELRYVHYGDVELKEILLTLMLMMGFIVGIVFSRYKINKEISELIFLQSRAGWRSVSDIRLLKFD